MGAVIFAAWVHPYMALESGESMGAFRVVICAHPGRPR